MGSRLFPCVLTASPAPAGLPMFGVLHPVLGFCHRVVPSLCMAIWWCLTAPRSFRALFVSLSGFPCFRMGVLLVCRSGACIGCSVFAVSAAFLCWVSFCCACLSSSGSGRAGCLVAVFSSLLLLLEVVLPWCFCCGFLSPCHLVAPSPSVVSHLGFFLWRLFRLGLIGCCPVLDPPFSFFFGGGGALLPFSSLFLLDCSNCFVVQAPWVSRTPGWGFLTLASCVC